MYFFFRSKCLILLSVMILVHFQCIWVTWMLLKITEHGIPISNQCATLSAHQCSIVLDIKKGVQKQIFFAIGKRHLTFSKNGMQHLVLSYNSSKRFTISSIKGPKKLKFEKFSLPLQTVVQQEPKTYYWIAKLFWLLLKKNFDKLSPGSLKRTEK